MCGRYHLVRDPSELLESGEIEVGVERVTTFAPRFNIAPSPVAPKSDPDRAMPITRAPIVRRESNAVALDDAVWPLIPLWAKGEVPRYSTANARSETMAERNAFKQAWRSAQRCLIPATGFYEWQAREGQKARQPWSIGAARADGLCFGGLWERSRSESGEEVLSFTIVTVPANALMREIHNAGANKHRMPLILPPERWLDWLDEPPEQAASLVEPFPEAAMAAVPVSTRVNNPHANEPALLEPVSLD